MKIRHLFLSACVLALVSCSSALEVDPVTSVPEENAIVDAVSARAALAGAYDALQDDDYYGEFMYTWGDLSSDNVQHSGTFTSYADADQNVLTADNGQMETTWDAIYNAVNRANVLIQKVPNVPGLTQAEKDDIIGQAYFIRALSLHNAVRMWGGVPIKLTPVVSITESSNVTRATVAECYTQILADLAAAEPLLSSQTRTRNASVGSVRALRARVLLYQASPGSTGLGDAQWTNVEAAATAVIGMAYSLAPQYSDLFQPTGANTPEDIFRLRFTDQDAFLGAYYYLVKSLGGRYEVQPTTNLRTSFESLTDARRVWSIKNDPSRLPTQSPRYYNSKYTSASGTDHPHVIRLAEVILIRAEARARQNTPASLAAAVGDYNLLRQRAGLAQHTFGVEVTDMTTVLAAIARERRSELAFEADRWFDLVRQGAPGIAIMVAHRPTFDPNQILYPIPQNEIDVTRQPDGTARLAQNPGY